MPRDDDRGVTAPARSPRRPRPLAALARLAALLVVAAGAPAALTALPVAPAATAAAAPAAELLAPAVPVPVQERQVLDGVNAERARAGAPPLRLDPALSVVAQRWADVVGRRGELAHNPRLAEEVRGASRWGEVVASAGTGAPDVRGQLDGAMAVRTWMQSPPHRAVLLDRGFTDVGVGLVHTRSREGGRDVWRTWWVADVTAGRRVPALGAANADGSRTWAGVVVKGALLGGYDRLGTHTGVLGLPLAPEFGPLRAGGYGQAFAGGSLYWSPATGTHPVRGAVRDRWAALGWEGGWLGYPVTGEFALPGGAGQHFAGGSLYWTPRTGAQPVRGDVRGAWARQGWERGRLGWPTGAERPVPGGARQDFTGGSVTWDAATRATTVTLR